MLNSFAATFLLAALVLVSGITEAQLEPRDNTCFQTASQYLPEIDIGSDIAIVYGVNDTFPDRVALWREKGYTTGMMTGIAWGAYGSYYGAGDNFKKDEVQTDKSGKLWMHGRSKTVGYNVPSPAYVDYIKNYVDPAIDLGVRAIYLEEPEYWAVTGWSAAFKKEWERFYGEPWQPPDSSVDAQYRASKLKYELYFDALKQVFMHIEKRAAAQGIEIECHVPTHSLINYAQWRIVSPESHLMDIEAMDGYIAQVWTGTARSHNRYRGVSKERTFETAFLEYGQALSMVRPTGRKVWFLADPIEDNPNHSWADYKHNYECTLVASLMWPQVHWFEVMPWPRRIFRGAYPKVDMETKSGERVGIPADYATQILTIINALNEMDQTDVRYDTGSRGIGVIVSDTLMFQRAAPHPSDPMLSSFYGLALPLLKNGIPVEVVQLENSLQPNYLPLYKVLLLTYEGQKPLKPEYHEALARWVRHGGCLIYVGDGSDPYHAVREWWNDQGREKGAKACDDLFAHLGVTEEFYNRPGNVGEGYVRVLAEKPRDLSQQEDGAQKVLDLVAQMFGRLGEKLAVQNYLLIQRGPFLIASVLDESISDGPLRLKGRFINLFEPTIPVVSECVLQPNERALLYDLEWARESGVTAKVVGAGTRVRNEALTGNQFTFTTRGPKATTANVRVLLPKAPSTITITPEISFDQQWDPDSSTLFLTFGNAAEDVNVMIDMYPEQGPLVSSPNASLRPAEHAKHGKTAERGDSTHL